MAQRAALAGEGRHVAAAAPLWKLSESWKTSYHLSTARICCELVKPASTCPVLPWLKFIALPAGPRLLTQLTERLVATRQAVFLAAFVGLRLPLASLPDTVWLAGKRQTGVVAVCKQPAVRSLGLCGTIEAYWQEDPA